ncbi:MAG: hypothetical protein P8K08_11135 [Fuerstiella sp.]|nr:hypothetical protein [Fuerstiella sp.]
MNKVSLGLAAVLAMPSLAVASDFDHLARKLPNGTNLLLAIDSDRVLASEMAVKNNWDNRTDDGGRPVYLPQEADKVLVAAQVDPGRGFVRAWEVAVMGLKESMPMRLVAKAEGGYTETIQGMKAAWVPSDAYFFEIDPKTMGLMHPANRQAVSRWAERQKGRATSPVSDYLLGAVSAVKTGPQIVLALDTQDVIQPHRVQQTLSQSEVVKKQKLNVDELTSVMTSMRGLKLRVEITDTARGVLQVDFGKPLPFNERAAKGLLLGALTNLQAELPGVEDWDVKVSGNTILCSGDTEPDALRRILSMLEIPSTKFSSLKEQNTDEASGDDMAQNSLAYFKSITKLTDDLEKNSKSSRGDNYWMDRYAQKIDRLPILHVDPELLDFGQKTVETLRLMSGARKNANMSAGVRSSNIVSSGGSYNSYSYGYGNSGYYNGRANARATLSSVNTAKLEERAGASSKKIEGFRLIKNATSEMRRKMTERYNIEF